MVSHSTGGEVDVRGCYTAIAAAHMTGIDIQDLAARGGLVDFIKRCQVCVCVGDVCVQEMSVCTGDECVERMYSCT